jgi:hypothetical protein
VVWLCCASVLDPKEKSNLLNLTPYEAACRLLTLVCQGLVLEAIAPPTDEGEGEADTAPRPSPPVPPSSGVAAAAPAFAEAS